MEPLVSVIIPTFNRASLIAESIQSVIDQTYKNWELIIVDDGSEDNTKAIVENFRNPKMAYCRIAHCGKLGKVRNQGMKLANGEYISFLDSDDLWRRDKLEVQLELFRKTEIMFTFSNGKHFGNLATIQPPESFDFTGNLFLPLILKQQFVMYMPSLLFKKNVLNTIEMIDENLSSGGDVDFFYRMAYQFNGTFSNQRLVSIRKHGNGMSSQHKVTAHLEDINMLAKFYQQGYLTKKQHTKILAVHYYKLGLSSLLNLKPTVAIGYFVKHNKLVPINYKGWARLCQSFIKRFL